MYKVFLTVRNRLAITTKCITALKKHSVLPHQIYVYDNLTNYMLEEHFMYFCLLMNKGLISQYTYNTKESTYNAFSKVTACNQFGFSHQQDPEKDKYEFLVFLDNDTIVTEEWDRFLSDAWKEVNRYKMNNIKIISQLPGGIMHQTPILEKICGYATKTGKLGGSELWCVKPNFFEDVGFLDVKKVVGLSKKHDQNYWPLLEKSSGCKNYILGTERKVAFHAAMGNSVCNTLTRNKKPDALEVIKFKQYEDDINKMSFDDFYKKISNDQKVRDCF